MTQGLDITTIVGDKWYDCKVCHPGWCSMLGLTGPTMTKMTGRDVLKWHIQYRIIPLSETTKTSVATAGTSPQHENLKIARHKKKFADNAAIVKHQKPVAREAAVAGTNSSKAQNSVRHQSSKSAQSAVETAGVQDEAVLVKEEKAASDTAKQNKPSGTDK